MAPNMENSTKEQKPHKLRKEIKRLTESREKSKIKNRTKSSTIKNYQDRLREVVESRDNWKKRVKVEERNTSQLEKELRDREKMLSRISAERDQFLREFQELKKRTSKFRQAQKMPR